MENNTFGLDIKERTDTENDLYYTNTVELIGFVETKPLFHHKTHDESIYSFTLKVPRLNKKVIDYIPIEVSERATDINLIEVGSVVRVNGQFRSFNKMNHESGKVSLALSVFARDILYINDTDYKFINNIHLDGHICKEPIFRITPNGREIGDIILAVNRIYGRSDYIPCIAWSRNARYASSLQVGQRIVIDGRIQSRKYRKKDDTAEEGFIERTVYEVSINSLVAKDDDKDTDENEEDIEEGIVENIEE